MNKNEFLFGLGAALAGLPEEDIRRSLDYYSEMIDDRIEDGLSEEEAVAVIGSVDEVASQIISETPLTKIVKARVTPKRTLRAWEIVLLVLGSPLWLPLLLTAAILIFTAYVLVWTFIVVMYAAVISFAAVAVAGLVGTVPLVITGQFITCALYFGIGLFFAGLTILSFIGTVRITRGVVSLCKKIFRGIKARAVGKGGIQ